jgi:beta-lactamase regulating signal transducer with metallopeptidase domain
MMHILDMSLTAGVVIIFVLGARLLLKKAPKIFSYALWAVVLFRLFCPLSFSSQFSIFGLIPAPLPVPGAAVGVNGALINGSEQTLSGETSVWITAASFIWLSGIAAMLIYSTSSLTRLRRKLVGAVRLRDNIYLADHITSPFVIGVIRPKIYLPSTLPESEQSYVVLHEQTHIRRLDHVFKLLAYLALALHWFNPLVWVAFVCCVKDMEMSCDECVLKQMGGDIKKAYGASLLSLATGRWQVSASPLAFGEGNIKGRIRNVMRFKKTTFWIVAAAFAVVLVAGIVLLTNPASTTILAFVDGTLSETEARNLERQIEQNPNVKYANFESREEAMKRFESKYSDKSLFAGIDSSAFLHRYYIRIRSISKAEQTANDISHIAGIAKVSAMKIRW